MMCQLNALTIEMGKWQGQAKVKYFFFLVFFSGLLATSTLRKAKNEKKT